MQLIFEAETPPSVKIKDTMSTLEDETVIGKPVINGDIKDILEEINAKDEIDANTDKKIENKEFENKENISANSEDNVELKEAENTTITSGQAYLDDMPLEKKQEECESEIKEKSKLSNDTSTTEGLAATTNTEYIHVANNMSIEMKDEEPNGSHMDISREEKNDPEKEKSIDNTMKDTAIPMEVDEKDDSITVAQKELEEEVTKSISAIVNGMVGSFDDDDDTANDFINNSKDETEECLAKDKNIEKEVLISKSNTNVEKNNDKVDCNEGNKSSSVVLPNFIECDVEKQLNSNEQPETAIVLEAESSSAVLPNLIECEDVKHPSSHERPETAIALKALEPITSVPSHKPSTIKEFDSNVVLNHIEAPSESNNLDECVDEKTERNISVAENKIKLTDEDTEITDIHEVKFTATNKSDDQVVAMDIECLEQNCDSSSKKLQNDIITETSSEIKKVLEIDVDKLEDALSEDQTEVSPVVKLDDKNDVSGIEKVKVVKNDALNAVPSENTSKISDEEKVKEVEQIASIDAPSGQKDSFTDVEGTKTVQNEVVISKPSEHTENVLDVEEVKIVENSDITSQHLIDNEKTPDKSCEENTSKPIIKLSNTMDILSDDEEESPKETPKQPIPDEIDSDKQCINLDDDDDIMLIDEDTCKESIQASSVETIAKVDKPQPEAKVVALDTAKERESKEIATVLESDKDSTTSESQTKKDQPKPEVEKSIEQVLAEPTEKPKPLLPVDFFKSYRKNLTDMTRDDLEEFCILKIVESIIDRSSLNDIRSKLKTMAQTVEEYKKKAMMLTKQNRDLQVVLKSVQEEQKKVTDQPIIPLKITRSVGMQVLMPDKRRRPGPASQNSSNNTNSANNLNNKRNATASPRNTPLKQTNNQTIPVPRLVPAAMVMSNKTVNTTQVASNVAKTSPVQNGVKITPVAQKAPEKRTHSRMQSQSVTVDLTDDEPPSKAPTKSSPAPPVRLVNQQNLLATPRAQFGQAVNSPRKVYIPISVSGPQTQNVRQGQTLMLKTVTSPGPRPRGPMSPVVRAPVAAQSSMQVRKVSGVTRHPAPLPDAMKQYQPPNWKSLPPAPDLKLSKVENGIVISWKIEGYKEDSYEEIASYQLYAYQETSAPPSTNLWKKIGDVKALPLPMACTLTQFMAGYKYFFAVRAVDIRSRLGPFSLPGSILLLNKM